jgi:hypothetical protein
VLRLEGEGGGEGEFSPTRELSPPAVANCNAIPANLADRIGLPGFGDDSSSSRTRSDRGDRE